MSFLYYFLSNNLGTVQHLRMYQLQLNLKNYLPMKLQYHTFSQFYQYLQVCHVFLEVLLYLKLFEVLFRHRFYSFFLVMSLACCFFFLLAASIHALIAAYHFLVELKFFLFLPVLFEYFRIKLHACFFLY